MDATIALAQPVVSQLPSRLRSLDLAGPAGRIEALLNEGETDAPFSALICHPHPLGGGNLHNKVVFHAMKVLNEPRWGFKFPALRFNFRGTGLSQGLHDGKAEAGDVLAALDWLRYEFRRPIVLVGFSFGAAMSIAACCSGEYSAGSVRALAALGLPIQGGNRVYNYPSLENLSIPKLFLSGDHDEFATAQQLSQIVASAAEPKKLAFIHNSDHFFTGHMAAMQKQLAAWLKEYLQ
jgi:uncharacterized protein